MVPCCVTGTMLRVFFLTVCYLDLLSDEGDTPLLMAFIFGHAEVARALLSAGANPELQPDVCVLLLCHTVCVCVSPAPYCVGCGTLIIQHSTALVPSACRGCSRGCSTSTRPQGTTMPPHPTMHGPYTPPTTPASQACPPRPPPLLPPQAPRRCAMLVACGTCAHSSEHTSAQRRGGRQGGR